jgi:hypothetical protein
MKKFGRSNIFWMVMSFAMAGNFIMMENHFPERNFFETLNVGGGGQEGK